MAMILTSSPSLKERLKHDFDRHILIAIDLSDQSLKALHWAAFEFYRQGDLFHLVHVNRCMQPQMTIQHQYPGATYNIPELNPLDERRHAENVKEIIKSRFSSLLDQLHIPSVLHLYLDTDNAPASAVCSTLFKVAEEVTADLLVVAAHNKAYGLNSFLLGSVADYCTQHCKVPLMVVRDFKLRSPPLVIPWKSPATSPATSHKFTSNGGAAASLSTRASLTTPMNSEGGASEGCSSGGGAGAAAAASAMSGLRL